MALLCSTYSRLLNTGRKLLKDKALIYPAPRLQKKTFDSVTYNRLMKKLSGYSTIGSYCLGLVPFAIWPINGRQRLMVGSDHSEWCSVTNIVPQGITFGTSPVHHIYKWTSRSCAHDSMNIADDTKLYRTIQIPSTARCWSQQDITSLQKWSHDRFLTFR